VPARALRAPVGPPGVEVRRGGAGVAALRAGAIRDGELVMIAVSDSLRRDPEFLLELQRPSLTVVRAEDCVSEGRSDYGGRIWAPLVAYVNGGSALP
jgi:hypothetical protein